MADDENKGADMKNAKTRWTLLLMAVIVASTSLAASAQAVSDKSADNAAPVGDAERGKKAYEMRCTICHSLTANALGPSHKDLIGRKAGTVAGFNYSAGFAKANIVWNEQTLTAWLTNPEGMIEGQKMGFYVMEPDIRADIVAYLKSLAVVKKP